jgi:hypothetical protein
MHLIANTGRKSIAHRTLTLVAAATLSMAVVTDALAAGHGGSRGGGGHEGGGQAGRIERGLRGPAPSYFPETPEPTFNPSYPNTLPESPETPVSPASPGSIFGNG